MFTFELLQNENTVAYESIQALAQSTLVIAIPSYQRKLDELNQLYTSPELHGDDKEKIKMEIIATEGEKELNTNALLKAFIDHYRFSKIIFVYDYELFDLKDHPEYFMTLTDQKKLIQIPIPDVYFLALYKTEQSNGGAGIDRWNIMNNKQQIIPKPFPNEIGISPVKKFFRGLFSSKEQELIKNYSDLANKMNEKFSDFLEKSSTLTQ